MTDKILDTHFFTFNPGDNGGESLYLLTKYYHDSDNRIYIQQELTLQSYCNCATINLCGTSITPEKLRQLANELESKQNIVKSKLKEGNES